MEYIRVATSTEQRISYNNMPICDVFLFLMRNM